MKLGGEDGAGRNDVGINGMAVLYLGAEERPKKVTQMAAYIIKAFDVSALRGFQGVNI